MRPTLATIAGRCVVAFAVEALHLPAAFAQDRTELERTPIVGHRELPKVLYILPWKKPLPVALVGRPALSVLDEALQPIDREVFRRGLRYDAQVRALAGERTTDPTRPRPENEGAPQ